MPTLDWLGKKAVVNHHKDVPYRLVHCDSKFSAGDEEAGNLLVQGDNLEALKALLPYYAGKVKLIYIDPPYNTGNEGWVYNDNVNSPYIQKWLGATVGKEAEDLSRHDKWLCMMYPRLRLLKEFLTEDGAIFVNLDDNEVAFARIMMDEIFGYNNHIATISWEKRYTRSNNAKSFYSLKDSILTYRKSKKLSYIREERTAKADALYSNPDNDPRGSWTTSSYVNPATKGKRPNLAYNIINPNTKEEIIHPTHAWKHEKTSHLKHIEENVLWWGKDGKAKYPRLKIFLNEKQDGMVPIDIWSHQESGTTDEAGTEIKQIFGNLIFETPKPTKLLKRIISLLADKDSIILDSFSGSGTTGHAVLDLNKQDGGNRKFILVEMEEKIAKTVTSERLKRVINGYPYKGKKETVLFEKKINLSALKNADSLLKKVEKIKEEKTDDFDAIKTSIKDDKLEVIGTLNITENMPPLGGGFRFCTLGTPLFNEFGGIAPNVTFDDLSAHIFFSETGSPLPDRSMPQKPLIGTFEGRALYLLFVPQPREDAFDNEGNVFFLDIMNSLPLPHEGFSGQKVVYASACAIDLDRLKRHNITFKQIPYNIEGGF